MEDIFTPEEIAQLREAGLPIPGEESSSAAVPAVESQPEQVGDFTNARGRDPFQGQQVTEQPDWEVWQELGIDLGRYGGATSGAAMGAAAGSAIAPGPGTVIGGALGGILGGIGGGTATRAAAGKETEGVDLLIDAAPGIAGGAVAGTAKAAHWTGTRALPAAYKAFNKHVTLERLAKAALLRHVLGL